MVDEMIDTVKAALTPGADEATKQKAAAILRGVLTMLDPGGAQAATSSSVPLAAQATAAPALPDLLSAIVERVRPLLPAEALADMPRFRVPLIDFGTTPKR
jgi:hypothetical protein